MCGETAAVARVFGVLNDQALVLGDLEAADSPHQLGAARDGAGKRRAPAGCDRPLAAGSGIPLRPAESRAERGRRKARAPSSCRAEHRVPCGLQSALAAGPGTASGGPRTSPGWAEAERISRAARFFWVSLKRLFLGPETRPCFMSRARDWSRGDGRGPWLPLSPKGPYLGGGWSGSPGRGRK